MWFDIIVKYYFRSVRSTTITIFLAVIAVVTMIYLLAKMWQERKQRRNLVVVAPLKIVHHPCLNNLQFNPIIVKSKTFLFHSITYLIYIVFIFTLYKLNLYKKYQHVVLMLINLYFSIITPLNIYWKNSSLRKYLRNNLLNDLCS